MHDIEPHFGWLQYYDSTEDENSPFYGKEHSLFEYPDNIYGYCIHPQWDFIGSETLYIKILYINYHIDTAVIECIGEWNDTLHNDIMHLKRNIIDRLLRKGIRKFILVGEQVFNFHGAEDDYYEEWFEDIDDEGGYIVGMGFRDFIHDEWTQFGVDNFIIYGGPLEMDDWRVHAPLKLCQKVDGLVRRRISL